MDLSRLPAIQISDEPELEPESPYNLSLDIISRPHGWEARIELNGARIRFTHRDRRELVRGLIKPCIERIIRTVPIEDVEMVIKAFEETIERMEREYYAPNLSNPSFN